MAYLERRFRLALTLETWLEIFPETSGTRRDAAKDYDAAPWRFDAIANALSGQTFYRKILEIFPAIPEAGEYFPVFRRCTPWATSDCDARSFAGRVDLS